MEFEKSIFRVHERLLQGSPKVKTFLAFTECLFFGLTVFNLVNLILFHRLFVDRNHELKTAIETQMKTYFYQQYDLALYYNQTLTNSTTVSHILPRLHYLDLPVLPLNYSDETGEFLYDNRT